MCEPTTMMVGSMAMAGVSAVQGARQGEAQAAMAQQQANYGYRGAIQQYQEEVKYQQRVSAYQWGNSFKEVQYRGELMAYESERYEQIAEAAILDLNGKYNDLVAGVEQYREATQYKMQNMWLNYHKGQSTRKMNSLKRGVEGRSVDALAYEAEAAMRLENEAALTSMQWNTEQALRNAEAFQAQAQNTMNAAKPGRPMAYVTPPAPMADIHPPSWEPYALQAQAGAMQGQATAANAIIGGVGQGLSAAGTYYSQTNPPTVTNNISLW